MHYCPNPNKEILDSEEPKTIKHTEEFVENFNEVGRSDVFQNEKYFLELQIMQKQLLNTMILMQQRDNLNQDRGRNIGTQININNMNVDMTPKKVQ